MNGHLPGATRLRVEPDGEGVRITDLTAGEFLSPRLLSRRGRHVRIALVGHAATLLAGDRLNLVVEVGPGVHLELVEPSGMVAYHARGAAAAWSAHVRVDPSGSLVWRAASFVVSEGADVERTLDLALSAGAVVAFRETLVLGRHGEVGGRLLCRQRVALDGAPLLVETLDLRDRATRELPGVLGAHRVVASAMLLGLDTAQPVGRITTPLAGPGALARTLTAAAHVADEALSSTWSGWLDEVARHVGGQDDRDGQSRGVGAISEGSASSVRRRRATITGTSTEATIPAANPLL